MIRLQGHLSADVVQSCVVTLGPVPAHLEVDFEMSFSASAVEPAVADLDPLAEEGPEPIPEGVIDLGEAVAQQLAIALDPYPRAPGASLEALEEAKRLSGAGNTEPFRGTGVPQEEGGTRSGINGVIGCTRTSELPGTSNSAKQRSPSVPGLPCCAGIGCALRGTIQGRLTSWRFQRRRCRSPVATCDARTMVWRPSNRSNARIVAS